SRRVLGDEDVLDFSAAVHPGGYSRQDIYITGGAPEGELWESGFACRTFRYAEISGLPALREIDAGMVRGLSVTYDTPPRSEFSCGDETLMRLYRRAVDVFGLRRPGEVEIRTKAEKHDLLYDRLLTSDFLLLRCDADDYLSACVEALTDEASDKEATFSPDPLGRHDTTTVMLRGIALARMAWLLWQQRGLTRPIETAYPALRRWLFSVELRFPDLLPTKGPEDRGLLREDDVAAPQMMMTALAFFETICRIADMAAALGLRTDAESCRTLASHVRRTYLLTFSEGEDGLFGYPAVDAAARCAGMTEQTETLMEILRRAATQTPDRRGWGVRGLRAILRALSEGGEIDAALTLLRDPALLAYAESDVAKAEDMSFAADLVELAAGVRPLEPGYSRFAFSPRAWKAVGGYHLVLDTPHGKIKVDVTPAGELTLVVPPCTLCRYGQSELRPGTYHLRLT
ncbi:MAG: hypothetical protein J6125_01615, partial [Clostridia bacterium]|nr:hypothetical protein [Clostridia bacterium]